MTVSTAFRTVLTKMCFDHSELRKMLPVARNWEWLEGLLDFLAELNKQEQFANKLRKPEYSERAANSSIELLFASVLFG